MTEEQEIQRAIIKWKNFHDNAHDIQFLGQPLDMKKEIANNAIFILNQYYRMALTDEKSKTMLFNIINEQGVILKDWKLIGG